MVNGRPARKDGYIFLKANLNQKSWLVFLEEKIRPKKLASS